MKRLLMIICASGALAVAGFGAPAQAKVIDSYCSPTGDFCTGVFKAHGRIKLKISTFSLRGRYGLCVTNPVRRRTCHSFRLEHRGGIYTDKVDFARNFPHGRAGRYTASWHKFGNRLGHPLHFRVT